MDDTNPFDLVNGEFTFSYHGTVILKDGRILKKPQVIMRLLSMAEYMILETVGNKGKMSDMIAEEFLFNKIYLGIYGVGKQQIDVVNTEAGFIPAVIKSAAISTRAFLEYPEVKFQEYSEYSTVISTMMALISRLMNINFEEVEKMPISKVFRYYAILSAAFPNECGPIVPKEVEESSKIPV